MTYLLTLNTVLLLALWWNVKARFDDHDDFYRFYLQSIERDIMSTQDTINAVVAQLAKAKDEIVAKIADLNVQIADAGVADVVDTSELTAAAQALDDVVPDAVPETPAE